MNGVDYFLNPEGISLSNNVIGDNAVSTATFILKKETPVCFVHYYVKSEAMFAPATGMID